MTYSGVCYDGPLEGRNQVSQVRRFCVPVMPTYLEHDENCHHCNIGDDPAPHGEHCTTYGVNRANCDAAAMIGNFLKFKVLGWVEETKH